MLILLNSFICDKYYIYSYEYNNTYMYLLIVLDTAHISIHSFEYSMVSVLYRQRLSLERVPQCRRSSLVLYSPKIYKEHTGTVSHLYPFRFLIFSQYITFIFHLVRCQQETMSSYQQNKISYLFLYGLLNVSSYLSNSLTFTNN